MRESFTMNKPKKSSDLYVTQEQFKEGIAELKSSIVSVDHKVDSLESRMDSLDSRMDSLESKFDSKFEKVFEHLHGIKLLVEEQNARNKFVLDGYTSLYARQDKLEAEVKGIKNHLKLG